MLKLATSLPPFTGNDENDDCVENPLSQFPGSWENNDRVIERGYENMYSRQRLKSVICLYARDVMSLRIVERSFTYGGAVSCGGVFTSNAYPI